VLNLAGLDFLASISHPVILDVIPLDSKNVNEMTKPAGHKTIAVFSTTHEAWIHWNALSDNGFRPILVNEHLVAMLPLYSNAFGGIHVQIPESEYQRYEAFSAFEKQAVQPPGQHAENTKRKSNWRINRNTIALTVFTALHLFATFLEWVEESTVHHICISDLFL